MGSNLREMHDSYAEQMFRLKDKFSTGILN